VCSSSPKPDPAIGQAAKDNVALSREMIQYYRENDAKQAPRQAALDALTTKLANQQIATSQFNDEQARALWDRYQTTGVPIEDRVNNEAMQYDSQSNMDKAAGDAANDVQASLAQARDAQQRNLARMGVNPADGRALAVGEESATTGALAQASAMNQARNQREQMGIMLRKDAASAARGMPGTAAQTFGVASAAGGQAAGAVGSAIGAANATAGTMGQGFSGSMNGNNSAASILNQQYQIKAQNSGGLGEILGAAGSLGSGLGAMGLTLSDKNMKEDRAPVSDDAALEGIRKTPVESWRYKSDSPAADGGQKHIGPMAQDVHKNFGDKVAPGGKMVDLISEVGIVMSAVRALDKKVDQIKKPNKDTKK